MYLTATLFMRFTKYRLEAPFKCDYVDLMNKTSNCETINLYFLKRIQNISAFVLFFLFLVSKYWLEVGFDFPLRSEMSTLYATLKD